MAGFEQGPQGRRETQREGGKWREKVNRGGEKWERTRGREW